MLVDDRAVAGVVHIQDKSHEAIATFPAVGNKRLNCSFSQSSFTLLKGAVNGFLEDEALTRGAAIAFYTATSFAPVLLIVIAIAGLVYGQDAALSAMPPIATEIVSRSSRETSHPCLVFAMSASCRLCTR